MPNIVRSSKKFAKVYPAPNDGPFEGYTAERCPVDLFKARRGYEQTKLKFLTTVSEKPQEYTQDNVNMSKPKVLAWVDDTVISNEIIQDRRRSDLNENNRKISSSVMENKKKSTKSNLPRGMMHHMYKRIRGMVIERA